MIVRALCVVGGLVVAGSLAACGGSSGDGVVSAPPVSPAPTSGTPISSTTIATPTTSSAVVTTTPATTAPATSTTAAATTLTPELEAELIDVYTNARRVLYEAFLDPPNADMAAVAQYWTPEAIPGWANLLEDWAAEQWRFEPGPAHRYYAEVSAVKIDPADTATVLACVVTDAAVFDAKNGRYIDPGHLSSFSYIGELRLLDGTWLVAADRQGQEFRDMAGCDA